MHERSYCVVRPLEFMDVNGDCILSEYDCPLLTFGNLIYCLASNCVKRSVSVVHECSHTCSFVPSSTQKRIEHEDVCVSELVYKHDWSNNIFCLNVYCM